MKIKHVFFDLDGTVIKSEEGIIKSLKLSLDELGIKEYDESILLNFIGPPLYESYNKYFDLNYEQYVLALDCFHEYYRAKGIFECELYDGILECIKNLKNDNYKVYLATSKPETEAKRIITHFELDEYFDLVCGQDSDHNSERSSKTAVIKHIIDSQKIDDLGSIIMVGDRENDIRGAKNNKIPSIGVLYGYGSLDELNNIGADYIVKNTWDIKKMIDEINGK